MNPYEAGDLESQGILEEKFPALARHLKRLDKEKGFSFKHWSELEDLAAARAQAEAIPYDEKAHEQNPYRQPNKSKQVEFERGNSEQVIAFYRREAQPIPLPFSRASKNLTQLGRIVRDQPEMGKAMARAEQLETEWLNQQVSEAKQQLADAQQKRQAAEKMLQRLSA